MNLPTLKTSSGIAALALTMSFGLAACGSSNDSTPSSSGKDTSSMSSSPSDSMGSTDAAAGTFGPACGQIPADGAGSLKGMATAPVASAASANPLLKTLVAAVTKAGLVQPLNSAPALTVFAPVDDAFAAIPKKQLNAVLSDKKTLTTILTHHVISGQLSPDQLAGDHKTLAGDTLTISGSGENFSVGKADNAQILCGGITTANATVYVIDKVLMPTG
jgi:uncharacterized surface protein with fasciclin (FAS1) repeats